MKTRFPFTQTFADLPPTVPIFPLPSAVLLPNGHLPLNIFEPRYINLVNDAISSHRLIGMIQPLDDNTPPELAEVGCAGRIIRYEETHDGRLEILLLGVNRFTIDEELSTVRGYRLIKPNWNAFSNDQQAAPAPDEKQVTKFKESLKHYLRAAQIEFEPELLERLDNESLVSSMVSYLPLDNHSKQILLESATLKDRIKTFTALLRMDDQASLKH